MKIFSKRIAGFSHKDRDPVSSQTLDKEEEATRPQQDYQKITYWKQMLDGTSPVLQLPTDRPRQAIQSFHPASYTFQLSATLLEALKILSQREDVTLFITLLATFQTLLYRYTGQEDLITGVADLEFTRVRDAYSNSPFPNALVLHTQLDGNSPFREVLMQVREAMLEARAYRDMPVEQVIETIQAGRDLNHHPLYQVLFGLEEALPGAVAVQDLHSSWSAASKATANVDLALFVQDSGQGITGLIEYNRDLFEPETIARMANHWQKFLEGIAVDSHQHIDALPLLTDAEWQQQVVEWNATRTVYPQNLCLHEIFEEQVERTPSAIATVFEQEQLTYRELNRRANQLAHHLQNLGVEPETLVAILLERGIDFVTTILAIFKAGGAFLPLDPQHPARRHTQILEQSRSRLVLTTDEFGTGLAEALEGTDADQRPQVIDVEKLFEKGGPKENLSLRSTPGNLAYVMFTSGSTGVPKGAMVEQVGMVNHIYAKIADLGIGEEDRVAQNGPPCFDIVVWQCLAALLVGGSVHIFKDEIALNPMLLLRQIEEQKITILQAVPSILRAVVQQAEALDEMRPRLTNLRWAVPTGDALPPELCRQWLQLYPAIPLLNTYGSTECSDDQCHYAIYQSPPLDYPPPIMPIGRPIQNIAAYVLDQRLTPVPVGVIGDLYIGGIGVGRGYLYDAQKTSEVFIPDPFSQEPGARLYKTRDRARYLPGGLLEFLGRSDNLVKVQGVRIEPGEIEAVLERHPAIRETVVIAREAKGGNKYLVAYIVPTQDQAPTNEKLRAWLREKLPEYMIPSAFVLMEAFPLTSNGKIDRKTLPLPDITEVIRDGVIVEPTTPTEIRLVEIVAPLLGLKQVSIDDNFFLIGGNSLMGLQLLMQLTDVFGIDFPTRTLLDAPTVRQLAVEIERLILVKLQAMSDDEAQLILGEGYGVS